MSQSKNPADLEIWVGSFHAGADQVIQESRAADIDQHLFDAIEERFNILSGLVTLNRLMTKFTSPEVRRMHEDQLRGEIGSINNKAAKLITIFKRTKLGDYKGNEGALDSFNRILRKSKALQSYLEASDMTKDEEAETAARLKESEEMLSGIF